MTIMMAILYMLMAAAAFAAGTAFAAIIGCALTFLAIIEWRVYWIRRDAALAQKAKQ